MNNEKLKIKNSEEEVPGTVQKEVAEKGMNDIENKGASHTKVEPTPEEKAEISAKQDAKEAQKQEEIVKVKKSIFAKFIDAVDPEGAKTREIMRNFTSGYNITGKEEKYFNTKGVGQNIIEYINKGTVAKPTKEEMSSFMSQAKMDNYDGTPIAIDGKLEYKPADESKWTGGALQEGAYKE